MYHRLFKMPEEKSFFLFGPRGTGKTTWIKHESNADVYIDLLDSEVYQMLIANPGKLSSLIVKPNPNLIVIDEIQRVPDILNEVHRLIEEKKWKFILTGSSARKLRKTQSNLLAGRALDLKLYPLTAMELGADFKIEESIMWGHLPSVIREKDKRKFIKSYITTYVREEVQQEGFARNIPSFARFLEAASFSQGSLLNISSIAREVGKDRKVVEDYFSILEDLLIGKRFFVFRRKAKRRTILHPKFYFFDAGVYRAIRPLGPLDSSSEINGAAIETLVFQELTALNEYLDWRMDISFFRTTHGEEVDFILYGERGFVAIEVKASNHFKSDYLKSLKLFLSDYPMAKGILLYTGDRELKDDNILILPIKRFLINPQTYIF